ncbi:MAG: NifB/NifX family molybdenum-iron cluster-binding protein [Desulfatiglans sp.]|nr:NifB/NifX family molybdenum-iron cluster-binding protein [Thermodesulfobacteriota bacterium]MEE4351349.1 NifB/NifX family molybdenum-iron cluster-binding protein [Desulfatiglans sp.]
MTVPRIAVVSTDGKTVNDHFGRAERFLIYDLRDRLTFVEERLTEKYSAKDPSHSFEPDRFNHAAALLRDCSKIYVTRIGEIPAAKLKELGIEPIVYEGDIAGIV